VYIKLAHSDLNRFSEHVLKIIMVLRHHFHLHHAVNVVLADINLSSVALFFLYPLSFNFNIYLNRQMHAIF
jgi:hypothetical protein